MFKSSKVSFKGVNTECYSHVIISSVQQNCRDLHTFHSVDNVWFGIDKTREQQFILFAAVPVHYSTATYRSRHVAVVSTQFLGTMLATGSAILSYR